MRAKGGRGASFGGSLAPEGGMVYTGFRLLFIKVMGKFRVLGLGIEALRRSGVLFGLKDGS